MNRFLVMGLGLGILAGCQSTHEANQYAAVSTALQGSKAMRQEVSRVCARKMNGLPAETRRQTAILLDTTQLKAMPLLCSRIVAAMANGDITYNEYKEVQRGNLTPKIVRVMQGTK